MIILSLFLETKFEKNKQLIIYIATAGQAEDSYPGDLNLMSV